MPTYALTLNDEIIERFDSESGAAAIDRGLELANEHRADRAGKDSVRWTVAPVMGDDSLDVPIHKWGSVTDGRGIL